MKFFQITLLAGLLLINFSSLAQTADSTETSGWKVNNQESPVSAADSLSTSSWESGTKTDDEFGIFLLLILLVLICGSSGAGAVLITTIILILFGCVVVGILSSSIVIGLYNRSFSKGFKSFVIGVPAVLGLFGGAGIFWIVNLFMHWWSDWTAVISGAIVGGVSGAVLGFFAFFIIQKLSQFFIRRYHAE